MIMAMFIIVVTVFVACSNGNANNNDEMGENIGTNNDDENETIEVDMKNGDDESVGTATLSNSEQGVKINFEGKNLPKGTHAFHIHEKGACEAPDFESAGDHFNPGETDHGFDASDGPHAGDLPNIVVDGDEETNLTYIAKHVTLDEDSDSSLLADDGTALVIHEGKDDGESQPAGDAGDRLACGVIEK